MDKIELNGKSLSPRELTVEEIEQVLTELQKGEMHPVESYTMEIPVSALAASISTGVEAHDLKKLTPSQLEMLFKEVERVNPSMAEQINHLGDLARQLLDEEKSSESDQSPAPSTPSDETAAAS